MRPSLRTLCNKVLIHHTDLGTPLPAPVKLVKTPSPKVSVTPKGRLFRENE